MENAKENRAAVRIWADGERYAAAGVLTEEEGRCALTYAEPGLDGSLTRLVFGGDSARMERGGAYPAVLEFTEGKTFSCEYGTPFGTARLAVRTKSFSAIKTGADIDTLTTIVKRYYEQDTWKENLIFEKDSFELLQDILESAGELSDRADCENLVTTAFAEAAIS